MAHVIDVMPQVMAFLGNPLVGCYGLSGKVDWQATAGFAAQCSPNQTVCGLAAKHATNGIALQVHSTLY